MKHVMLIGAAGLAALAACAADTTGRYSQALTAPAPGLCGAIETHVIGVFQTPNGSGTIYLDRPGKHVLILSAHEKTTWHVKTAPDAILEHVYAVGFHDQIVDLSEAAGTPTVIIDSMDKNQTAACGYAWPNDGAECDTDGLLQLASERTGHEINSFAGCRTASTWHIDKNMAAASDCGTAITNKLTHFFSCDAADTTDTCGSAAGGSGATTGSDGGPIFY